MPPLLVTSEAAGAGRTAVAAGLARLLAQAGRPVWLARLAGDGSTAEDARTFAAVPGVRAAAAPIDPAEVTGAPQGPAAVIEAPAGEAAALASRLGARRLAVVPAAGPLPAAAADLAGVVATFAPASELEQVRHRFEGLPLLAVLPEDRLLATPTVATLAQALAARYLYQRDGADESPENVLIGSIAADPGTPYFRRAGRKVVITRFDKVDVVLAAMLSDVSCLVLTGGYEPVEYVLDRLQNEGAEMTVLLTEGTTLEAMRTIEGLYGRSRFAGRRKLERVVELLGRQLRPDALPLS